jgi:hypothetical protein
MYLNRFSVAKVLEVARNDSQAGTLFIVISNTGAATSQRRRREQGGRRNQNTGDLDAALHWTIGAL